MKELEGQISSAYWNGTLPASVNGSLSEEPEISLSNDEDTTYSPYAVLINGDCRTELSRIASDSVDLIVTSPPYADQRAKTYGGVKPDRYAAWFLPIADELQRVLKPTGSFILNVKEPAIKGGKTHSHLGDHPGDAKEGLALDGGVCMAQEKLLSG